MKNKKRMASYVLRANGLMAAGDVAGAREMLAKGVKYYSGNVIKAISPYASADSGLLVFTLRTLAKEVESNQTGAKELAEELERISKASLSKMKEKIQKPTMK